MKTPYARLEDVEGQVEKLKNILFALKNTDSQAYAANYEALSTDAALRAERITCQLRSLVYASDLAAKNRYLGRAAEAQGITVESQNGVLSITIPGLLPKRRARTNTAFLFEPLNYAMQAYRKESGQTLYRDCVVCFIQSYDRSLSLPRVRDYDNLEFKQLLDTIAPYVLIDDSGLFCDTYHTTEPGSRDSTIVHVMEKPLFPKWVMENHKKRLKNISDFF